MNTVQETDGDDGRDALEEGSDVAQLVDLACAQWVVAEEAHGPAYGTAALEQLHVVSGLGLDHDLLVGELMGPGRDEGLLPVIVGWSGGDLGVIFRGHLVVSGLLVVQVILDEGIVGNLCCIAGGRDRAGEEHGS